jgi:PPOX class probable F420-dependent enzyme
VSVLLTGDATAASESSMLADPSLVLDADVLKVGHHGSSASTTDAFLDTVTPSDAVISVGANNPYGHPTQATLDRLAAHGATVYRTDLNGTVVLTSDCNTYSISTAGATMVPPEPIVVPTGSVSETPAPTATVTPLPPPPQSCCKYCTTGKACGDSCMMRMIELPKDIRALLEAPNYAHLATVMKDGAPQSVAVWVGLEGDRILVGTGHDTAKARNSRRDPRVALSITDQANSYRSAMIRGRVVEQRPGEDCRAMHVISRKYTGEPFPIRGPGRIVLVIEPEHVRHLELPFTHRPG